MKIKRIRPVRLLLLSALLCLPGALGGCGQEAGELVVGIMPDFDSIPFVVAKQQGYLPESVTLEIYMSPVDRDSALYAGHLDGTISDVLAVGLARQGGIDVRITSKTDGCYGLLTHTPVDSAADLAGKQVAMSVNTIIEYVADAIVADSGGDPSLLEKVAVPKIPSRLELLANRQIDAITVPEPYVTAAVAQGAFLVDTSQRLGINPGVMLFTQAALGSKEKTIKAMYEAYNKAVDYILANSKDDFLPAVIQELGLPESALEASLPAYTHAVSPAAGEVERAMAWLRAKELLEEDYTYDQLVWSGL